MIVRICDRLRRLRDARSFARSFGPVCVVNDARPIGGFAKFLETRVQKVGRLILVCGCCEGICRTFQGFRFGAPMPAVLPTISVGTGDRLGWRARRIRRRSRCRGRGCRGGRRSRRSRSRSGRLRLRGLRSRHLRIGTGVSFRRNRCGGSRALRLRTIKDAKFLKRTFLDDVRNFGGRKSGGGSRQCDSRGQKGPGFPTAESSATKHAQRLLKYSRARRLQDRRQSRARPHPFIERPTLRPFPLVPSVRRNPIAPAGFPAAITGPAKIPRPAAVLQIRSLASLSEPSGKL